VTTILDKIVAVKRQEVAAARLRTPLTELQSAVRDAPSVRDFHGALAAAGPVKLIAEIKKASPSKGVIRSDFRPLEIADIYARNGATCLSVLTDESFFQGHLRILAEVRQRVAIPVLRKDFILDPYQVYEARCAGADAVLLIAECLDDESLHRLYETIGSLQMAALIEFHDPCHLDRVLALGANLIGINNRDLKTFATDLGLTLRLRPQIPVDRVVVGESGIRTADDVRQLRAAGVQAMLVGESLMAASDIGLAVRTLLETGKST
jgi:indole-3-glycerol phosphate synthase